MRIHVAFTPGELTPAPVGIVVDVLRATSTICQALASGYGRVLCCAEVDEARALAESEGSAKLAGERRLEHLEGFDFGNSPRELDGEAAAETLILTTTNGTRLLVAGAGRIAEALGGEPEDSARAAILLAQSFPSALDGLGASGSAMNLRGQGLEADVERCAQENALAVVPRYIRRV